MEETRNASTCFDGEEDRISRLPDNIIHHIMSFIDTKYAVQTSLLSKRWIDTWKSLPFLIFNRSSFSRKDTERFVDFVYMVFMFRDGTNNIQKFSVTWAEAADEDIVVIPNVNRWILFSVKHDVEEVTIRIGEIRDMPYRIPHRLLNCKSLRELEISVVNTDFYLVIFLPTSMNLPQLKVLNLQELSFSDVELSKRLFSSCPVLESLEMVNCNIQTDNQRNLIVDNLSLKTFLFSCSLYDSTPRVIKLCAPNLEVFKCRSFFTKDFSLEISSPLSSVGFQMFLEETEEDENAETYLKLPSKEKDVYAKRMVNFLRAVSMVKKMELSSGFLEVLSQAPDLLDCQPPRLCDLQYLFLEMWYTRGCLRAIAYLCKISPHITYLSLKCKESNSVDVGYDWEAGLFSPGMLSHLEYVQIEEVEGCDAELKLMRFLLKNAENLEKVAIFFCSSVGSPDGVRQIEQFKDKLRAVPTASSIIQFVFET